MEIKNIVFILATVFSLQPMLAMDQSSPNGYFGQETDRNDQELQNPKASRLDLALNKAANSGDETEVRELLADGANVNAKDDTGWTALHHAAWFSMQSICKLLIEAGADVNACTARGTAVITCALNCANRNVIKLLVKQGADIRAYDNTPDPRWLGTPLEICASSLKGSLHLPLIKYSKFTPYYTDQKIQEAQRRTRTRLLCIRSICHHLPMEVEAHILSRNLETWQDACCTPLKIHTCMHTQITELPIQVIRTLLHLKNNALDLKETIKILKTHKFNELRPLMIQATQALKDESPNEREELNHDLLEENFGKKIEEVITDDCLKNQGDIL